ncbi:MAG: plasmid recombination protein [Ruminococcus sp.]|nr:plasmid recombination protein [Ruminococcus sp.]
MKKTISAVIGKGSTHHNNRKIITENVDKDKIYNNVIIVQDDIKIVYHELFDEALEKYNAKQTRRDRRIRDYHEHIRHSRQEKEFHEVIFQIGNRDDTHIGTADAEICADILKQFAEDFQRRNPHLRVFNAVIHMDEETPHLHIDFVPFATEQKRGLSTRVSLTKALEQQGFKGEGKLNTASKLWIDSEKQVLAGLMAERGIEWEQLGTENPHLSVLNYKKQERQKEIEQADAQLSIKQHQLTSAENTLSCFQDKISSSHKELEQLRNTANDILRYIPDIQKSSKTEKKFDDICFELDEQLKSSFTIMRHKDEIRKNIDTLQNITKNALDLQYKSENTVYDLHQHCDKIISERDDAVQQKKEYQEKYNRAERRNLKLEEKISYFQDLLKLIEYLFPNVVAKAKEIFKVQQNKQLEQPSNDRKKKKFELE